MWLALSVGFGVFIGLTAYHLLFRSQSRHLFKAGAVVVGLLALSAVIVVAAYISFEITAILVGLGGYLTWIYFHFS